MLLLLLRDIAIPPARYSSPSAGADFVMRTGGGRPAANRGEGAGGSWNVAKWWRPAGQGDEEEETAPMASVPGPPERDIRAPGAAAGGWEAPADRDMTPEPAARSKRP